MLFAVWLGRNVRIPCDMTHQMVFALLPLCKLLLAVNCTHRKQDEKETVCVCECFKIWMVVMHGSQIKWQKIHPLVWQWINSSKMLLNGKFRCACACLVCWLAYLFLFFLSLSLSVCVFFHSLFCRCRTLSWHIAWRWMCCGACPMCIFIVAFIRRTNYMSV